MARTWTGRPGGKQGRPGGKQGRSGGKQGRSGGKQGRSGGKQKTPPHKAPRKQKHAVPSKNRGKRLPIGNRSKNRGKSFPNKKAMYKATQLENNRNEKFFIPIRIVPCLMYHSDESTAACSWNLRNSNLVRIGISNNPMYQKETIIDSFRSPTSKTDTSSPPIGTGSEPLGLSLCSTASMTDGHVPILTFTSFADSDSSTDSLTDTSKMRTTNGIILDQDAIPLTEDVISKALTWLKGNKIVRPVCGKGKAFLSRQHHVDINSEEENGEGESTDDDQEEESVDNSSEEENGEDEEGESSDESVDVDLAVQLQNYINALDKMFPDLLSRNDLWNFIQTHEWSTEETPNEECDCLNLRKFIFVNIAKETKIIIHLIDGSHRFIALDYLLLNEGETKHSKTEICVVNGFYPRSITPSFIHSMATISANSQDYASQLSVHGPRDFLSLSIFALDTICKEQGIDFLFEENNGLGTTFFETDVQGNFKNPNGISDDDNVWASIHTIAPSTSIDELREKVKKPVDITDMYIQLWLTKMASLIKDVLLNSPWKLMVDFNIDEVCKNTSWDQLFKPAHSEKKRDKYGYFFKSKQATLLAFCCKYNSENIYNAERYLKQFPSHVIEVVQILLWSRLSESTYDILKTCFSCLCPEEQQLESNVSVTNTWRWISSMVHSITSSVYYSKIIWIRSKCQTTRRLNTILPDEFIDFSLLMSAIEEHVPFFVRMGPNPKPGFWFYPLKPSIDYLSFLTLCHALKMDKLTPALKMNKLTPADDQAECQRLIGTMQDAKFDIVMKEIKNAHKTRAIKDITKKVVIVIQRKDDLIEDLFTASVFQYHSLVFLGYSGFNEHDKRLIIPRTIEDESEGNEVVVMDDSDNETFHNFKEDESEDDDDDDDDNNDDDVNDDEVDSNGKGSDADNGIMETDNHNGNGNSDDDTNVALMNADESDDIMQPVNMPQVQEKNIVSLMKSFKQIRKQLDATTQQMIRDVSEKEACELFNAVEQLDELEKEEKKVKKNLSSTQRE